MRKNILVIVFFTITLLSNACDICGCGAGGSFMGMIPQFGKNQIGFRHTYRTFTHPNTILNVNGQSRVLRDENFQSDISLRFFKGQRWQFMGVVPLRQHIRHETLRTTRINGVGDISASVHYIIVNNSDSMDVKWKNLVMLGAGVMLPTGKYMQRDETKVMLPILFQIGSGAYQYFSNVYYTLRYQQWGLNVNAQYTLAMQNELKYQLGDRVQTMGGIFYKKDFSWNKKKTDPSLPLFDSKQKRTMSVLPSVGYAIEHSEKDREYDVIKPYTGGTQHLVYASLDFYFEKWALNLFAQQAFYNNIPFAQPENKMRVGLGVVVRV